MRDYESIRPIESLDQVTIPLYVMNLLKLQVGDPIRIYIEDDKIVMQKFSIKKD